MYISPPKCAERDDFSSVKQPIKQIKREKSSAFLTFLPQPS